MEFMESLRMTNTLLLLIAILLFVIHNRLWKWEGEGSLGPGPLLI